MVNDDKTLVADTSAIRRIMAEAENAAPALLLLSGPSELVGKQWPLVGPELVLGRAPSCEIYVDDPKLSKNHARILVLDGRVALIDLNSTNGTEVGNDLLRPQQPRELQNNDLVQIGNLVFKFLERGSLESVGIQKTFERSQIDALTQIFNKGAYLTTAAELYKRARATGAQLSVIVFDLDFFKKVNDTYGHQAGDYVLKALAQLVHDNCINDGAFFARYGGEEFVVLLPNSSLTVAADCAESIRAWIEHFEFVFGGARLAVTISAGVAPLNDAMESAHDLFELADQASYASKRGGRNRVTVAQPI